MCGRGRRGSKSVDKTLVVTSVAVSPPPRWGDVLFKRTCSKMTRTRLMRKVRGRKGGWWGYEIVGNKRGVWCGLLVYVAV